MKIRQYAHVVARESGTTHDVGLRRKRVLGLDIGLSVTQPHVLIPCMLDVFRPLDPSF